MEEVLDPPTPVAEALKAINELCDKYLLTEKEKDELAEKVTEKNKEMAVILGRVTAYMKEAGMEDYVAPTATVGIDQKWRVNLPDGDQNQTLLFEHLRERGIFDAYATVNSNSLNSLYMKDWAEAKNRGEGMTFSMPGIDAPKLFETSKIKPKKVKKA